MLYKTSLIEEFFRLTLILADCEYVLIENTCISEIKNKNSVSRIILKILMYRGKCSCTRFNINFFFILLIQLVLINTGYLFSFRKRDGANISFSFWFNLLSLFFGEFYNLNSIIACLFGDKFKINWSRKCQHF